MKSVKYLFLFFAILSFVPLNAQVLRGNGQVTSDERDLPKFRGIIAKGSFELFISQGEQQKVIIEADQNLHNLFIANVRNEMLDLQIVGEVKKAKSLKVYVTLENLNYLLAIGAVDVKTDTTFKTEEISIFLSGVSGVKLNIDTKFVDIEIADGAYAYLQGKTERIDIHVTDEAELNAFNLQAKKCNAKISGYSDAKINVLDEMKLRVTGAGNLYYKGNPIITDRIFSGSGFIIKRKLD